MNERKLGVFKSFASFVLTIVENMSRLIVLSDSTNTPTTNKTYPLLSSQLQQLPPPSFFGALNGQSEWLRVTLSPKQIEDIEVELLRL